MTRIAFAVAATAILFAAAPASAQPSASMSGDSMSSDSMSSDSMQSMTCADMMTKAKSMPAPTGKNAMMAQSEMKMAQDMQAKNDEARCKVHMKKALDSM